MALLPIPVWTVPPEWSNPVAEGLEWLTAILGPTRSGAEQRQWLRPAPRRTIDMTPMAIGEWRSYYDALMTTPQQSQFYLPLWWEASRPTVAPASGDTSIVVRGERYELSTAKVLHLRGERPWEFEIAQVASVVVGSGITTFTLVLPLINNWSTKTRVYKLVVAELYDQPTFQRYTDNSLTSAVKFRVIETASWALFPTLDAYRTSYVVDFKTDENTQQQGGYERIVGDLDNETGVPLRIDLAGIPFQKFTPAGWFRGQAPNEALKTLLYYFRGRLVTAWFVNPTADFLLAAPAATAATNITVKRNGFTDLGGPTDGRQDIRIKIRGGSDFRARITESSIGGSDTEVLTLDTALPLDISAANVRRISFMTFGRLDQDSVELSHQGDMDGVCSTSFGIRRVPDIRVSTDWTPPPFPNNTMRDDPCWTPPD